MNKISGIRHVTFSGSMGLDGIPRIEAHHTFSETKNPESIIITLDLLLDFKLLD